MFRTIRLMSGARLGCRGQDASDVVHGIGFSCGNVGDGSTAAAPSSLLADDPGK
jgi:hypothetical protein